MVDRFVKAELCHITIREDQIIHVVKGTRLKVMTIAAIRCTGPLSIVV
ncbi:hypothetical protein [Parasedimentitalea huanghaiensis]|uniref:Uncharacterized protein n=1 Tax=Parasedimentitalea huanghaiensis TaxID=2682100 RepID=A0A6L6WLM9_9RHOB|nr:hypothetical protein [Zongyanglinia huanghaiensis]MVO18108.1 hypothetical protein [Zongyanglinia huanghaiensis]